MRSRCVHADCARCGKKTRSAADAAGGGTVRLAVILLLLILPSASAQRRRNAPTVVSLPDQLFDTKDGNILFHELVLRDHLVADIVLGLELDGRVSNQTSHTFRNLRCAASFRDAGGSEITNIPLYYQALAKGASAKLGLAGYPERVTLQRQAHKFEIKCDLWTFVTKHVLRMVKPVISDLFQFENDDLAIRFAQSRESIGFVVQNKTQEPIKVDWNQISFVDAFGSAHGITHAGIKYVDAKAPKQPSTIPPGAKLEDLIAPADNVYFAGGQWHVHPLMADAPLGAALMDKQISVFMPLEIKGMPQNFNFVFKIVGVEY
jgi:hypothetical protein